MFFVVLLCFFARVCTCHLHTSQSCCVVVGFLQFFIYHYFAFIYVSSAPQVYLHSCLCVCMSSFYAPTHCLPRVCVPPACVSIVQCLFSFFFFIVVVIVFFLPFLFCFYLRFKCNSSVPALLLACLYYVIILRACSLLASCVRVSCMRANCVVSFFLSFFHCCCCCFLFCYYYFVFICVSSLPALLFVCLHDSFSRAYSRVFFFLIII